MPSIAQIVEQIRTAIFGKDVRENIALGIEKCYEDSTANAQIALIQAKGAETIASIPSDYTSLANEVTGVNTEVDAHILFENGVNDIGDFGQNLILNSNNVWTQPEAKHVCVPLNGGDIVEITSSTSTYYGFLKSKIAVQNTYGEFSTATGFTTRILVEANSETGKITAPADAKYLYIAVMSNAGVSQKPVSVLINGVEVQFNLRTKILSNLLESKGILDYYTPHPYVIMDTGKWGAQTGEHISIKVNPGDTIEIKGNSEYAGFYAALKSDNYGSNVNVDFCNNAGGTTWQERKSIAVNETITFTAPADCNYVAITMHGTQNLNQCPQKIKINNADYIYNVRKKIDQLEGLVNVRNWSSKKWACVGDSLTEENSRTTKHYHDYIHDITGINVVNMGLSGSGYKRKYDTSGAFYQRISNVPNDCDVVTIFGSVNDPNNYPNNLGDVTDSGTDTVCGCINQTLTNLYSVLPTVQLGVITPPPSYLSSNANLAQDMEAYVEKIVQICKRRSVPCLDLYHEANLRPDNSTFRTLAYSKDSGEGVHPDETGHKLIAGRIKVFLDSLIGDH